MQGGSQRICAVVPTFDNAGTVLAVLRGVLERIGTVFVVDDGSTDGTGELLRGLSREVGGGLRVLTHGRNRGKGRALVTGFRAAREEGFTQAVTIDADGQHYPEDIGAFLEVAARHPDAMLIGSRNLSADGMPGGNTFANRFSNFWFRLQTGVRLPDTQTGFRLYQLGRLGNMRLLTSRYEAELAMLVSQCWKGTEIIPVPIRVYYPPEGVRVTHFRPFMDFLRISLLNCVLCLLALFYGRPRAFLRRLGGCGHCKPGAGSGRGSRPACQVGDGHKAIEGR